MATEPVAAPRGRLEVSTRLGGWPLVLVVTGVALLVLLVRLWIARRIETPWILLDEVIYSELGKSLASDGHPLVRGASISFPSLLYPATIAPAWLATDDVPTAYAIAKVINVVAMTAVTVPTYFWARRLVPARWALVAVALVLLMPSMLYTSALMSENAFFPLFVASAFACAAALERPTLWRQLLVFVPIALAIGVRVQAIVLLAVLPGAIAAKALFDARAGDPPRLRHAWATVRAMGPTLAVLAGGVLAFAVFERSRGRTVSSALGAYSFVTSGGYSFGDVRHWVALHFAELAFSVGVVPACALLVLVGLALAGWPMTEAERAFLAVASVSVLLVVLQVAAFASRFSLRIEERYMFPLAALLFIALVLWIARGMERPVVLTALSAFVPVILSLTLKLHELLGVQILSDTFALIPVWRVTQLLNGDASSAQTLLVFGTTVAAAAFALVPRRFAAFVLPLGVAAFLAFGSYPVYGAVRDYADALAAYAGGGDRDWVDDAVGAHTDVPYLYDASRIPGYDDMLLWQTEFWNRDLDTVVRLGPFVRDSLTEQVGSVDPVTGRITTGVGSPRYVVATNGLVVAGTPVDSKGGLTLYRVAQPLRLGRSVEGVYADGWMGASAAMTQFATLGDRPGTLQVRLSRSAWRGRDVPGHVTIRLGRAVRTATGVTIAKPLVQRRWTIHAGASRTFTLRTPRPPFRVEIGVDPTFSPSDYGLNDTRQLGAQVELDLAPR